MSLKVVLIVLKQLKYNNEISPNDPIKKSRDGTELTEQLGYMICNMFEG